MIEKIFSIYIIILVVAKSSLLFKFREWIKAKTPQLQIQGFPHLIECRLCLGFWVSLVVCICFDDISNILPYYGISYFIATLERT